MTWRAHAVPAPLPPHPTLPKTLLDLDKLETETIYTRDGWFTVRCAELQSEVYKWFQIFQPASVRYLGLPVPALLPACTQMGKSPLLHRLLWRLPSTKVCRVIFLRTFMFRLFRGGNRCSLVGRGGVLHLDVPDRVLYWTVISQLSLSPSIL